MAASKLELECFIEELMENQNFALLRIGPPQAISLVRSVGITEQQISDSEAKEILTKLQHRASGRLRQARRRARDLSIGKVLAPHRNCNQCRDSFNILFNMYEKEKFANYNAYLNNISDELRSLERDLEHKRAELGRLKVSAAAAANRLARAKAQVKSYEAKAAGLREQHRPITADDVLPLLGEDELGLYAI